MTGFLDGSRSGTILLMAGRVVLAFGWLVGAALVASIPPSLGGLSPTAPVAAQDNSGDPASNADRRAERRQNRETTAAAVESGDTSTQDAAPAGDFDCIDFQTREEAQAVLDEDPSDPYNLDPSGDGVACALLPSEAELTADAPQQPADASSDTSGTNRQRNRNRANNNADTTDTTPTVASNCGDYTQEEAQQLLDDDPRDRENLDPDGDGIACEAEELGSTADARRAPRQADAADGVTSTAPVEDLDCADFSFQEEAQLVLDSLPTDPYNLDPNIDGVACSSLPFSNRPVVNAVPTTGVGPSPSGQWTIGLGLMIGLAVAAGGAAGCRRVIRSRASLG